jgi:dienelactone hydrolase
MVKRQPSSKNHGNKGVGSMKKWMNFAWLLIVLILFGCDRAGPSPAPTYIPATPTQTPEPTPEDEYAQLLWNFRYDADEPLDVEIIDEYYEGEVLVQEILFNGGDGEHVPAYLVKPPGAGPFPAVLYLHAGAMDKDQYLPEGIILAGMDVVSLLIEGPLGINRVFTLGTLKGSVVRKAYINTVIELRRGLDLLESLPEVDSGNIGYAGHSYGAVWGGVLAGMETRIKAYVLIAGAAQVSTIDNSGSPDLDAIHFIGHATQTAFLFQFAEVDAFIEPEQAQLYFDSAPEPKTMLWYWIDHHGLKDKGREDRLIWLSEQLGFEYTKEQD